MIQSYVTDLADKMGVQNPDVTVVEGRRVGCADSHLLKLTIENQQVSALIHQSELEELQIYSFCERLELKVRSALTRLHGLSLLL